MSRSKKGGMVRLYLDNVARLGNFLHKLGEDLLKLGYFWSNLATLQTDVVLYELHN